VERLRDDAQDLLGELARARPLHAVLVLGDHGDVLVVPELAEIVHEDLLRFAGEAELPDLADEDVAHHGEARLHGGLLAEHRAERIDEAVPEGVERVVEHGALVVLARQHGERARDGRAVRRLDERLGEARAVVVERLEHLAERRLRFGARAVLTLAVDANDELRVGAGVEQALDLGADVGRRDEGWRVGTWCLRERRRCVGHRYKSRSIRGRSRRDRALGKAC
jgi:hypothetical protein